MASRPNSISERRSASAGINGGRKSVNKPSSGSANTSRPPSGKNRNVAQELLSKEEEYMRLNAELEDRTASLLKEAEAVFHDQDEILTKPSSQTLDIDYTEELDDSLHFSFVGTTSSKISTAKQKSKSTTKQDSRCNSATSHSRPSSQTKTNSRPKSKTGVTVKSNTKSPIDDMNPTFDVLQDRITLADTISALEEDANDDSYTSTLNDNILPPGAEDMGSEATIRFLKAKLRVMQEEMDRLSAECKKKNEKLAAEEGKLKELSEEQTRLQKTNQSLQAQIDKYKKLFEDSKHKSEGLESQLIGLRKDLDAIQRDQKHAASNKGVLEVRLNRALEEVEKYKAALQKAKSSSKDSSEQERKRNEQLVSENKRLEKQKNELMTGFKKQMKLIDILKKQKMHIEAAKLLQFSEEEFVKALDWGS